MTKVQKKKYCLLLGVTSFGGGIDLHAFSLPSTIVLEEADRFEKKKKNLGSIMLAKEGLPDEPRATEK
jgi:hypothetical protein